MKFAVIRKTKPDISTKVFQLLGLLIAHREIATLFISLMGKKIHVAFYQAQEKEAPSFTSQISISEKPDEPALIEVHSDINIAATKEKLSEEESATLSLLAILFELFNLMNPTINGSGLKKDCNIVRQLILDGKTDSQIAEFIACKRELGERATGKQFVKMLKFILALDSSDLSPFITTTIKNYLQQRITALAPLFEDQATEQFLKFTQEAQGKGQATSHFQEHFNMSLTLVKKIRAELETKSQTPQQTPSFSSLVHASANSSNGHPVFSDGQSHQVLNSFASTAPAFNSQ